VTQKGLRHPARFYQSEILVLGPLVYGSSTLPLFATQLRLSDDIGMKKVMGINLQVQKK